MIAPMQAAYHCYRRARGVPGRALASRDVPVILTLPAGVEPQSDQAWALAKRIYADSTGVPLDQVEEDGMVVIET